MIGIGIDNSLHYFIKSLFQQIVWIAKAGNTYKMHTQ